MLACLLSYFVLRNSFLPPFIKLIMSNYVSALCTHARDTHVRRVIARANISRAQTYLARNFISFYSNLARIAGVVGIPGYDADR